MDAHHSLKSSNLVENINSLSVRIKELHSKDSHGIKESRNSRSYRDHSHHVNRQAGRKKADRVPYRFHLSPQFVSSADKNISHASNSSMNKESSTGGLCSSTVEYYQPLSGFAAQNPTSGRRFPGTPLTYTSGPLKDLHIIERPVNVNNEKFESFIYTYPSAGSGKPDEHSHKDTLLECTTDMTYQYEHLCPRHQHYCLQHLQNTHPDRPLKTEKQFVTQEPLAPTSSPRKEHDLERGSNHCVNLNTPLSMKQSNKSVAWTMGSNFCQCLQSRDIHCLPMLHCPSCDRPGGICGLCSGLVPCSFCYPRMSMANQHIPETAYKAFDPKYCPVRVKATGVRPPLENNSLCECFCLNSSMEQISDGLCNSAHRYAHCLGSRYLKRLYKQAQPPPPLYPPRPLQSLFPTFFVSSSSEKKQNCVWSLFNQSKGPKQKIPQGGLLGFLEDAGIISVHLATSTIENLFNTINFSDYKQKKSQRQQYYCNCDSPVQRYPEKNGTYSASLDAPTKATGCHLIDTLNRFMDALLVPPKSQIPLTMPNVSFAETKKTGNILIDHINEFLDKILSPSAPVSVKVNRDPLDPYEILRSYLKDKPAPLMNLSESCHTFFPCLSCDKPGIFSHLTNILSKVCSTGWFPKHCAASRHDTYVDFDLVQ